MAVTGSHRFLGLLVLMIPMLLLSSSSSQVEGREFIIGGNDGWVVKPSEDYNHWAQRNRFQVNDTLHFKYDKGNDSVLVVKEEDYDSCNTNNPIQKFDNGDSIFQFNNSGPFFFITGNVCNCKNGQKLVVVVMAVRHPPPPHVAPPECNSPPPQIPSSGLTSPTPAPATNNSGSARIGVSVGLGVGVGVVLMYTGFVGLV